MNLQKIKAFTLVELIVVITILAILGTIAFISLQSYSSISRDSVRLSDISKIKTSLELFNIDSGKYPETTNGVAVTFSGETIWTQGTFGESTFNNVERLDKIPKDPLTDKEYTYSITNTKNEYEIAGLMEGSDFSLINESYAAQKTAKAKVSGQYNGRILKANIGPITYVLAVPTIISGSGTLLRDIMREKSFVYNGYSNLPLSYSGSSYNTTGENGTLNLVDENNFIVYSGSLDSLVGDDATGRINMLKNLQTAYTGTAISDDNIINEILSIDTFTESNFAVASLARTIVNTDLGGEIPKITYVPSNCNANSSYQFNGHTYNISNSFHGDNITVTSNAVNENNGSFTYDLAIECNDGNYQNGSESSAVIVSCDSGFYNNGTSCSYQYTTASGNANYYVSLPVDSSAHWYTVGTAKADGYIKFNISRRGDTYGYGGIYIDGVQAFFPREYGNILYNGSTYYNFSSPDPNVRFKNYWVETGVNTSNNGASGYADIWVNAGELIKVYGHRSNMTITGNLQGVTGGYN